MKYLFIIPARGGSKGIPRKNIAKLRSAPLIEYTINAALKAAESFACSKVIVSTDDEEIAQVSRKCGALVPFLRPKSLADDQAPSHGYVNHAIEYYAQMSEPPSNVVILQPTSPLRSIEDIINTVKLFEKKNANSLITVYEEHYVNEKVTYYQDGFYADPLSSSHNAGGRRQDDKPLLVRNGAVYITDVQFFLKETRIICDKPLAYIMPKYRSINIDTPEDLLIAEKLLK